MYRVVTHTENVAKLKNDMMNLKAQRDLVLIPQLIIFMDKYEFSHIYMIPPAKVHVAPVKCPLNEVPLSALK